jgi:DNA-binding MarR family transcriptional regulator
MSTTSVANVLPLVIADVFECAGALRRVGDELAGRVGQTQARWQLLSVLSEGDWTAATAARRLGVSRQAVQRIADVLQAERLVRIEPNPAHRRSPLLRLTHRGDAALRTISAAATGWHRRAAADIALSDLETTRGVLQAITARCNTQAPH